MRYNGVDTDFFTPLDNQALLKRKFGFENKIVLMALASSWTPKKGVQDYLKLAERLDDRFVLVMVGFESQQKRVAAKIQATPVIRDRNILRECYNSADFILNLSYEESFGLTTAEGLSCGIPSIVYNKTASPELVIPETGFVVEAGDLDTVEMCIDAVQAKGRVFYSTACRNRAKLFF